MHLLSESMIHSLEQQDPEFGAQVRKWKPKVLALSLNLQKVLGDSLEDVIQDFLHKMWTDTETYRTPQVRYKKQIWEVIERVDKYLSLRRSGVTLFLRAEDAEEIKKAGLGTFLYAGIRQYYVDRCSSHFTGKNGYATNGTVDIVNAEGKPKTYANWEKVSGVVALPPVATEGGIETDVVDLTPSKRSSPEDEEIFESIIRSVKKQISDDAKKYLDWLLQRDEDFLAMMDLEIFRQQQQGDAQVVRLDEVTAAKYFGKSRTEIRSYRTEIIEALPQEFLRASMNLKQYLKTASG